MTAPTLPTSRRDFEWVWSALEWLGEILVALFIWFAIDSLGHWRISPTAFAVTAVMAWVLPLSIERFVRRIERGRRLAYAAAMALSAVALGIAGPFLRQPLTFGQIVYAVVLVFGVLAIWRSWLTLAATEPRARGLESLRRLLVGAAAAWAVLAFFTPLHLGGVDARWYAYMLKDFLEQARSGTFPVFLGLGETAYNGAAHPFRTAPLFMWSAGVLDLLTARALGVYAIQHLTVVTGSLVAGLGLYSALVALESERRWIAAGVAMVYALCPGVLAPIYNSDMYMTYMAIAVLPLVVYGNGRALMGSEGGGYVALAASLSLAWMAHPPSALSATLASVLLQGGRLFLDGSARQWRRAIAGAMVFCALSGYYFYSMSELPPRPGPRLLPDAVMLAGFICVIVGVGRFASGRSWTWLVFAVGGAAVLARVRPAWAWWLLAFAPVALALGWWLRRRGRSSEVRAIDVLWFSTLAAAGLAMLFGGDRLPEPEMAALRELQSHAAKYRAFFLPIESKTYRITDFQPGAAFWLLLAPTLVVAWIARDLPSKLWSIVAAFLIVVVFPLPKVSEFLVGYGPPAILSITACPLPLRMLPVLAAFGCGAVFVVLASRMRRTGLRVFFGAVIAGGVVWSTWEARKFVQRGWRATSSSAISAAHLRPENIPLHRFAYDLVPLPDYFHEGKMDGRLEPRLLGVHHQIQIGPDEIARAMEARQVEVLRLVAASDVDSPEQWLRLSPSLTLQPGEHLLLRFDFRTERYAGHLIFNGSQQSYREYYLPEWGMPKSFGTKPGAPKVLSLWNSGNVPETYELSFLMAPEHVVARDGGHFATVHLSHYDPASAPLRVENWNPLRIEVESSEPGFLESPRVMLPGYVARVNGKSVPVERSPHRLVLVPVGAGTNIVEIDYVGTWKLWISAAVSGLAWVALLVVVVWSWRRRPTSGSPLVGDAPLGGGRV